MAERARKIGGAKVFGMKGLVRAYSGRMVRKLEIASALLR